MIDFNLPDYDNWLRTQEEGIQVPIYRPGTEEVLMNISVAGPDSEQQRRATERITEENIARGRQTPMTSQEQREQGWRFLAMCCKGWDAKDSQGNPIPFTEDNAFQLFSRYAPIREQVDAASANRLRFIKRSLTA